MLRTVMLIVTTAFLLFSGAFAATPQYGTPDEARAMLDRAVAALKADQAKALELFNKGEGGFKDRDLYVFCVRAADGLETAHPTHRGVRIQDVKDAKGFAFGEEILRSATDGIVKEVTYFWPRPGSDEPVEKVTSYTKIGDQICGVGYYK